MGSATVHIDASPDAVYALVSDITRYGEWSPENLGGEWLDGATGPAVGAKFKGRNKRKAPWTTKCTVTVADPGREFSFEVGKAPDTRWGYKLAPGASGGTDVTEYFEILKEPMILIRWLNKLGTGVSWSEREKQLEGDLRTTLERLKAVAEAA